MHILPAAGTDISEIIQLYGAFTYVPSVYRKICAPFFTLSFFSTYISLKYLLVSKSKFFVSAEDIPPRT